MFAILAVKWQETILSCGHLTFNLCKIPRNVVKARTLCERFDDVEIKIQMCSPFVLFVFVWAQGERNLTYSQPRVLVCVLFVDSACQPWRNMKTTWSHLNLPHYNHFMNTFIHCENSQWPQREHKHPEQITVNTKMNTCRHKMTTRVY